MKKISEGSKLAKLKNFEKLISIVEELDKTYNPKDKKITLTELKKVQENASKILSTYIDVKNSLSLSNTKKEELSKSLGTEVSRILITLKGAGIKKNIIEDARTVTSVFRPQKKAEVKENSGNQTTAVSKTHKRSVSFQDKIEAYEALYNLLTKIPDYSPNEEFLSLESIAERLSSMQTLYSDNSKLDIQLDDARNLREKIFHAPETGLIDIGRQSKNYIKSLFGQTSKESKRLSALTFN
jgi:hypothetical protein